MGLLEDELRATFAEQAAPAPAIEDIAGQAVRHAGRLRRRRTVTGTFAAVLALALAGAGVVVATGNGGPTVPPAATTTPAARLSATVLDGHRIITDSGQAIDLSGIPEPRRASRAPGGWLVEADDNGQAQVWWVAGPPNERSTPVPTGQAVVTPTPLASAHATPVLLASGERVAVGAADGDVHVAWAAGGRVTVATMVSGRLVDQSSTSGIGLLRPIGFLDGGGVLLADAGGVVDLWHPDKGGFHKGPQSVATMVAASRDRIYAVDGVYCLVQLAPAGMAVLRSRCDLSLDGTLGLYPSPDGRWLAVVTGDRVDLYDLDTVWTAPAAAATWRLLATSLGWGADGTFEVVTVPSGGSSVAVVRLHTDGNLGEPVELDAPPGTVTVVANLMS